MTRDRLTPIRNIQPAARPAELLTLDDVADVLRVSARTVSRLVKSGDLPAGMKIGTSRRWKHSELDAWLNSQQT